MGQCIGACMSRCMGGGFGYDVVGGYTKRDYTILLLPYNISSMVNEYVSIPKID